ncbi:MAG: AFG1 family ATPase [Hyphomicrobiaceae bacterium]|nr:AFG1 family ATPase [Hyphomicrobiaceae bacterium]
MTEGVLDRYKRRVAAGEFEVDEAQLEAATRFDVLARDLEAWRPPGKGLFSRWRRAPDAAPRGVYMHGGVGRGKTMLMDLFYETVRFEPKRRRHFHEFIQEAHERIAVARRTIDGDPIPHVALEMAGAPGLLCFDELHVTDIADAMILGRFFKIVFERRVVIVATSNAMPDELYRDGLNRQLFLPFIDLIEDNLDVVELKSAKDFRLEKLAGRPLYFTPVDASARAELDGHWERLTGSRAAEPVDIEVKGRMLHVPASAHGVARFTFADLCEKPLGAADYLAIAHAFHTVLIDAIPVLNRDRRDHARRFINLIDTLYDNGVCLIASAEAEPDSLYLRGDGADLFTRTASRLTEMRRDSFVARRADRIGRVAPIGLRGGQEEGPK